ncbi:MAG: DUF4118 domain-containing protein [Anaerolineae bacterium]|nr:DUF4118 domain-containing protein [Anaerolineae bacterium]
MLLPKATYWRETHQLLLTYCTFLAFIALVADYLSGPLIQFPILYVIPVGLASWYGGRRWGYIFAVNLAVIRLCYFTVWDTPWGISVTLINALIRIIVFTGFVYLVDRVAVQQRALENEVRILSGLLPICSFCKKIRDEDETWQPLEGYITHHSEAEFSHGLCPECARIHYPEYYQAEHGLIDKALPI